MGFNKRTINLKYCIKALENNNLKGYYGKSDVLFFEDDISSRIYDLFCEGKTDEEILINIKKHMEEQSYEMY
jgi:hypothetical protein